MEAPDRDTKRTAELKLWLEQRIAELEEELDRARNGVNLVEYVTTSPHGIIIVEEKDALKSYQLLEDLAIGNKPHTA